MSEQIQLSPEVKAKVLEILTSIQEEGLARKRELAAKSESTNDMLAKAMREELAPLFEELAQAKKEMMAAWRELQNG